MRVLIRVKYPGFWGVLEKVRAEGFTSPQLCAVEKRSLE